MINAIDAQIRDAIRTWARDIDLKLVQKPLYKETYECVLC